MIKVIRIYDYIVFKYEDQEVIFWVSKERTYTKFRKLEEVETIRIKDLLND